MANITLYYIDGISRENTPYFENATAQSTFMANHIVHAFTDGFYPPKYRDTITLDLGTGFTGSRFNYLSLLFNSRQFYYFIDSIEYISEDIVALHISIDSIQTYMFDINIHESIIERKFIDRYHYDSDNDEYYINRDYLRENLSNGVWQEPQYSLFNIDTLGVVIAISKKSYPDDVRDNLNYYVYESQLIKDTSPKLYCFVSNNSSLLSAISCRDNPGQPYPYGEAFSLSHMTQDAEVETLIYLPFCPFVGIDRQGNILRIDYNTGRGYFNFADTRNYIYYIKLNNRNIDVNDKVNISANMEIRWNTYIDITIGQRNDSIGVSYSSSYITQMIDNNYQSYNFGERSFTATFPLYYTNKTHLYFKYLGDISSGYRFYGITDIKGDTSFSKGGIVSCSPIYLSKITNTWNEWQAMNRATIPMAMANYFIQGMAGGIAGDIKASASEYSATNAMLIANNNATLLPKKKRAMAMMGASRKYGAELNEISASEQASAINRAGSVGSLVSTATSEYNAWLAPNSIKQTSSYYADYISGGARNVYYNLKVIDFEQVAWYYHRCGFLVDTPFKSVWFHHPGQAPSLEPFLKTLASRYYFDYYKFQYADIDLTIMCTEDMIADVISRLTSGIRVWYVDHGNICDYQYDNVERSVLS